MKPILFNTSMVKAILEGRKTVTRRVVKFKPGQNPKWTGYTPDGAVLYGSNNIPAAKAPYDPGDILYVRETWGEIKNAELKHKKYVYKATDEYPFGETNFYFVKFRWHPSIHMPKAASRLFLRVKSVRVERLQDIDDTGVEDEGCLKTPFYAIGDFKEVWNSTIKPADLPAYGWDSNPWVWVIEFERISKKEAIGGNHE